VIMFFRGADWIVKLKQQRYLHRCQNSVMRDYLQSEFPSLRTDYRQVEYLAVDLEMTGLNASDDHILSIGFVPVIDQRVVLNGARHIYVSSDQGVGQSAVIHGIHDKDIDQATPLAEALGLLLDALKGRVMVLHCAQLDLSFLEQACRGLYNSSLYVPVVDTMALEDQRLQRTGMARGSESLRLGDCRRRYNLPDYSAHNALIDAVSTAELFLAQTRYRFGSHPSDLRHIVSIK